MTGNVADHDVQRISSMQVVEVIAAGFFTIDAVSSDIQPFNDRRLIRQKILLHFLGQAYGLS